MTPFFQRGGLWVLAQGLLVLLIVLLAAWFGSEERQPILHVSGLALLSIGTGVGLAGAVALGRSISPFPKPPARARLVRHGIYSLIRHPLYAGAILASIGWALLWQSWPALLAAFAGILFFDAKARCEEKWLREKFPEYAEYERSVKRFVPWLY